MTRIRPFSALPLAVALAVTFGALSGCSPDEPGTAAVVDGKKISVEKIQDTTKELQVMAGPGGGYVPESTVLALTIAQPVVDGAMDAIGVKTTEKEVTNMLDQSTEHEGKTYSSQARNVIKSVVSLQKLMQPDAVGITPEKANTTAQKIVDDLKKLDIKVNPRYGTFDPTQVVIAPTELNWMEKKPTPSPSAVEGLS